MRNRAKLGLETLDARDLPTADPWVVDPGSPPDNTEPAAPAPSENTEANGHNGMVDFRFDKTMDRSGL